MKWTVATLITLAGGSGLAAVSTAGSAAKTWSEVALGASAALVAAVVVVVVGRLFAATGGAARWRARARCTLCSVARRRVEAVFVCLTCDAAPLVADDPLIIF